MHRKGDLMSVHSMEYVFKDPQVTTSRTIFDSAHAITARPPWWRHLRLLSLSDHYPRRRVVRHLERHSVPLALTIGILSSLRSTMNFHVGQCASPSSRPNQRTRLERLCSPKNLLKVTEYRGNKAAIPGSSEPTKHMRGDC